MSDIERAQEQAIDVRRHLAVSKFAERGWRDRAMDLTKDLDEARSALTDTERERDAARDVLRGIAGKHCHLSGQWTGPEGEGDGPHCHSGCSHVVARAALAASPTMTPAKEEE